VTLAPNRRAKGVAITSILLIASRLRLALTRGAQSMSP
jgi:hypothetical protein